MVNNPPGNAGNTGSIPGPGRFHMLRSNWTHAPQLLSPGAATTESTTITEALRPWSLCSTARKATTIRSLHATARESLHAATKTQHSQKIQK